MSHLRLFITSVINIYTCSMLHELSFNIYFYETRLETLLIKVCIKMTTSVIFFLLYDFLSLMDLLLGKLILGLD